MFSNSFPWILDLYSMLPTVYLLNKIPWRIKVNIIYHGGRPCPSSVLTIKAADNRRYSMQCSDGTYSLFKIQTKTPRATMDRNLIVVVAQTRGLHFITQKHVWKKLLFEEEKNICTNRCPFKNWIPTVKAWLGGPSLGLAPYWCLNKVTNDCVHCTL